MFHHHQTDRIWPHIVSLVARHVIRPHPFRSISRWTRTHQRSSSITITPILFVMNPLIILLTHQQIRRIDGNLRLSTQNRRPALHLNSSSSSSSSRNRLLSRLLTRSIDCFSSIDPIFTRRFLRPHPRLASIWQLFFVPFWLNKAISYHR